MDLFACGERGTSRTGAQLFIVPNLKFEFVLGIPWLESANPAVDWSRRTISFENIGDFYKTESGSNSTKDALKTREELNSSMAEGLLSRMELLEKKLGELEDDQLNQLNVLDRLDGNTEGRTGFEGLD